MTLLPKLMVGKTSGERLVKLKCASTELAPAVVAIMPSPLAASKCLTSPRRRLCSEICKPPTLPGVAWVEPTKSTAVTADACGFPSRDVRSSKLT